MPARRLLELSGTGQFGDGDVPTNPYTRSMAWRVARSLLVLRAEVLALHPGTTVWTIGDEDHQDEPSDHNPNAAGVVCASDTLGNAGLDLHWYSRRVVASKHPALKYVIFNRQIWSTARAGEGWRPYRGRNPHTGHVHVSVGRGPDGQSTGPYDDTSPWGLLEEDNMPSVHEVWYDDIIEAPPGYDTAKNPKWSPASVIRSAQTYARSAHQAVAELRGEVAGLTTLVERLLTAPPVPITPEQLAVLLEQTTNAARAGAAAALERVRLDVVDDDGV